MIQNKDILVVKNDKDSTVTKLDTMIDDGMMKCTYVETTHNTLKELSRIQDFLYRNFHNYVRYKDMQPDSNQPARLYTGCPTKMSLFFFGSNFYKYKETFKTFSPQILEVYRILLV